MRTTCQIVLTLLVTALFLHAQDAPPAPTSPSSPSNCDFLLKQKALSVSGGGHLLHKVAPKYPKAARRAHLQGTVRLSATIAKDGNLKDVTVLEGDPTLAAAATEAVKRWRYEPYRVNDVAVEVPTAITVNFKLDGHAEFSQNIASPASPNGAPVNAASETPVVANGNLPYPVYESGRDIEPPKPVFTPDPDYTRSARKARVQGNVVLALVLTPEGNAGAIEVCNSLDAGLDQKAVEAVSRWKFKPAIKDGNPVAVRLRIDVSFRLY